MPKGWKRSFGIYLCEELREELIRIDPSLLDTYRVSQVKEKYGEEVFYNDSVFFLPIINRIFEMTKL